MQKSKSSARHAPLISDSDAESFLPGLARAYGGAIIFSLPLMMTMEMWWLGFYMEPLRLALLIVILIPVLVGLSHLAGFEDTFEWRDDLLDALVACAVGGTTAAVLLFLFSVVHIGMDAREIIGKISLQAVPGSIGALLAQSLLGGRKARETTRRRTERYVQELFLMGIGALFLALNVAPTEEMVLIAYQINELQAIALVFLALVIMHAFVYSVQFHGQLAQPVAVPFSVFVRYTLPGYAVSLFISLYILWTFGRLDGAGTEIALMMTLVLGFPAAIGAAAARLVL